MLKTDENGEIDIENFKSHGLVELLHTSYLDIPLHDQPMEGLFNQILNASSEHLLREFEYRLYHICHFIRGSATCSEIILEALKATIHPQYTLKTDLNAFSEPFLSSYLKGSRALDLKQQYPSVKTSTLL